MARPLRIEFAGALYHVMSRGNERRSIVRDDADREKRFEWLRRTVEAYGWYLHAFVLMTNHEHLFVETPQHNLSAGMQFLNGSYTGYFNRRHRRAGHLLQGRFKAHLVDTEGYFSTLSRYLHLNPWRARMVTRLHQYPWSSYPGYHRATKALPWVVYDQVLGEFARDKVKARAAYRQFVRAGMTDPPAAPWADAVEGLLIGADPFVERVGRLLRGRPADRGLPQLEPLRARPPLDRTIEVVAKEFGQRRRDLCRPGTRCDDPARAMAAYLARQRFGYPATEAAAALGYRGNGSATRALKRIAGGPRALQVIARRLEQRLQRH